MKTDYKRRQARAKKTEGTRLRNVRGRLLIPRAVTPGINEAGKQNAVPCLDQFQVGRAGIGEVYEYAVVGGQIIGDFRRRAQWIEGTGLAERLNDGIGGRGTREQHYRRYSKR